MLEAGLSGTLEQDALVVPRVREAINMLVNLARTYDKPVDIELLDPPWADGWKWDGKRGSLPRRISTWFKKETGFSLQDGNLTWLGNKLRDCIVPKGASMQVRDKFDWAPGDYHDYDSCFFKSRRQVFPFLSLIGARAIIITHSGGDQGRTLLVDTDEGYPVVFNSYGQTLEAAGTIVGGILMDSVLKGSLADYARFTIGGSDDYPVYINDGKGIAFVPKDGVQESYQRRDIGDLYRRKDGFDSPIYCESCAARLDTAEYGASRIVRDSARGASVTAVVCPDCVPLVQHSRSGKWAGTGRYGVDIYQYPLWSREAELKRQEERQRRIDVEMQMLEERRRRQEAQLLARMENRQQLRDQVGTMPELVERFAGFDEHANNIEMWIETVIRGTPGFLRHAFLHNRLHGLVSEYLYTQHPTHIAPMFTLQISQVRGDLYSYLLEHMREAEWESMAEMVGQGNFNLSGMGREEAAHIMSIYIARRVPIDGANGWEDVGPNDVFYRPEAMGINEYVYQWMAESYPMGLYPIGADEEYLHFMAWFDNRRARREQHE